MAKKNETFVVRYSYGTGRNFGKAKNTSKSLKSFRDLFRKPMVTSERFKDYMKMNDKDQGHLKSVNGWFYRTQVDGPVRNRGSGLPSDIVTLDLDYATPEFLDDLTNGQIRPDLEWFLHTSRRHTDEKPRIRLFIILAKPVPNELYGPVSRIIAQHFDPDMQFVDRVSFRPAQMMFMPTISKDGDFVFHENNGDLLDWSDMLDVYELTKGDWRDITQLPQVEGEHARVVEEKAEDPTEKEGIVGNFCRAYNVMEAIEAFDLPYEEVSGHSGKIRYTYLGGTTTNGAEVQDDGLFLYSHHGSDPVSDMLVNSFDLVRIHKFGELDEKFDHEGKPMSQRPSFKAMLEDLQHNEKYKAQAIQSKYDLDAINDDFNEAAELAGFDPEIDEDHDPEIAELIGTPPKSVVVESSTATQAGIRQKRKLKEPPPKDWMQSLQTTQDNNIIANSPNLARIIQNDLRTRNSLSFNEFTERVVTRHPLRTRMEFASDFKVVDTINGDSWEDIHTTVVRAMIESANGPGKTGYGFKVSDRDMEAGIELAARQAKFHPVREYLESLDETDADVAERLFIDYLGCPDTPYYRQAARLFLVGAVARIFEPGHKFDFVPILHGAQGKRKTTFIRILACDWYGELKADFRDENKLVEQMMGAWILEMPELSAIARSQVEDSKAFVSAVQSHVRLAWARRSKVYKRQCVFIGSTNDEEFLMDSTGNRRWWPIKVPVEMIDTDKLLKNRDAVWGSALSIYRAMRAEQPYGDLNLSFDAPEALAEAAELQEQARKFTEVDHYAEVMSDWLDDLVDPDAATRHHGPGSDFDTPRAHREFVTVSQVWVEALEQGVRATQRDTFCVGAALRLCGWYPGEKVRRVGGKVSRVFCPGPEVLERWKLEDAEDSGENLI